MDDRPPTSDSGSVFASLQAVFEAAKRFIRQELWDEDLAALPRVKRFAFSSCRVTAIVVKGFVADNCALQASALTYITLMSMVPVLALMLSVSKGLGAQERLMAAVGLQQNPDTLQLEVLVGSTLSRLPEQMALITEKIFTYVEKTNFGTLGTAGLLLLLWAVIKSMSRVENSFNLIWGVRQPRSLLRKFADYFSVLIVVPILILTATSVNAMLSSAKVVGALQEFSGSLYWIYERGIRLSGLGVIVLAFTFLYAFMPNTKVRAVPAFAGGIVGGILWYVAQWVYLILQVGVTKYNTIYGTFAAVPFFLAWLYANWTLVLFGAEVCFAVQNHGTFTMESAASRVSSYVRQMLGLVFTFEVCKAFCYGQPSWSAEQFGKEHAIPARLVADVMYVLTEANVLLAVNDPPQSRFVPAMDLDRLTVNDVERAFRGDSDAHLPQIPAAIAGPATAAFTEHYKAFSSRLATVTFRDLLLSGPHGAPAATEAKA